MAHGASIEAQAVRESDGPAKVNPARTLFWLSCPCGDGVGQGDGKFTRFRMATEDASYGSGLISISSVITCVQMVLALSRTTQKVLWRTTITSRGCYKLLGVLIMYAYDGSTRSIL